MELVGVVELVVSVVVPVVVPVVFPGVVVKELPERCGGCFFLPWPGKWCSRLFLCRQITVYIQSAAGRIWQGDYPAASAPPAGVPSEDCS